MALSQITVRKPVPASAPNSFRLSVEVNPKSIESITPFPSESITGDCIVVAVLPVEVIPASVLSEEP